jgi:tRNA threonylcarbamoyladenosine biosynthesis protein TsaB
MYILAVDTCDSAGSVAVLHHTRLLGEINIESPLTHSQRLMTAVDYLLMDLKLDISRMDGYAVAAGPGSFTGIRIGMSTVKALAASFSRPVAPVSRLEALAVKLAETRKGLLCPFLDAKKNQVYTALYTSGKDRLQEVIPEGAYDPDAFLTRLPARRIIHFVGSGSGPYRDKIRQHLQDKARISPRSSFVGYETGLLGYDMIKHKRGMNSREVVPLYLRKSQAEEKH